MNDLLRQIRDQYEVVCQRICLGELQFDFWSIADLESVLNDQTLLLSHQELPWQPYWAETWDAAHGVAGELAERDLKAVRVLDLGCGMGLTGTVAAARGACVVMGDYAPPALPFARLNSWPWRERVQVRRLNWREDRLEQQFDLIVGSDILYDREDLPYLDAFWRAHLAPQGSILLGDPTRAMTREFLHWVAAQGWQMTETRRLTPCSDRPIRLIELR
jgi:predicted nicotinamide N-methyase